MQVAHYSTYGSGGTAAVLMRRLHEGLCEAGVDSHIRYRSGNVATAQAIKADYCQSWLDRQRERLRYRFENLIRKPDVPSYFSRMQLHRATRPLPDDLKADVIHLHWLVDGWICRRSWGDFQLEFRSVWTIHDMNPLAGGCFTYSGCERFMTGCQKCPLLRSPFDQYLAAGDFRRRFNALAKRHVHAVGNSQFTTSLARRSGLFRNTPKVSQQFFRR